MRALPGCALALALSFGGAEGQSGTIVYNWVAPLEVDAPGRNGGRARGLRNPPGCRSCFTSPPPNP